MPTTKKVSEKSTKQEIWQAYNETIGELSTLPIEFAPPKKEDGKENFIKNVTDLKLTISDNLDKIANNLLKSLNDAEAFRLTLEKERAQIVDDIRAKKEALALEIDRVRSEHLNQEKEYAKSQMAIDADTAVARQREEGEYKYNLAIKRRQDSDVYEAVRTAEANKLKEREEKLAAREKEIAEMEKRILEMPKIVEDAVVKSRDEVTKELITKYGSEINGLKVEAGHQKNIDELNIKNLEAQMKTQAQEIDSLRRQLSESSSQLKEMAVAVIEGGSGKDKIGASTNTAS